MGVPENKSMFENEMREAGRILQKDRHRSCFPYEWFGPSPEPRAAGSSCQCFGCEARFNTMTYDPFRE